MKSKAPIVAQLEQNYRFWARLPIDVAAIVLLPEVPPAPIHRVAVRPTFPPGVCRTCGCTEHDACLIDDGLGEIVPCSWVDRARTRCSACR